MGRLLALALVFGGWILYRRRQQGQGGSGATLDQLRGTLLGLLARGLRLARERLQRATPSAGAPAPPAAPPRMATRTPYEPTQPSAAQSPPPSSGSETTTDGASIADAPSRVGVRAVVEPSLGEGGAVPVTTEPLASAPEHVEASGGELIFSSQRGTTAEPAYSSGTEGSSSRGAEGAGVLSTFQPPTASTVDPTPSDAQPVAVRPVDSGDVSVAPESLADPADGDSGVPEGLLLPADYEPGDPIDLPSDAVVAHSSAVLSDSAQGDDTEGLLIPPDQPSGQPSSAAARPDVGQSAVVATPAAPAGDLAVDRTTNIGSVGAVSSEGGTTIGERTVGGNEVVFRPGDDDGSERLTLGSDANSGSSVAGDATPPTASIGGGGVMATGDDSGRVQPSPAAMAQQDASAPPLDITPPSVGVAPEEYHRVEVSLPPETLAAMQRPQADAAMAQRAEFQVEEGFEVEATDGNVGEVAEILRSGGGAESHLVVRKGLLFKSDVSIPFSAIDRVEGRTVYLNVEQQYIKLMEGDDTKPIGGDTLNTQL